MMMMHQKNIQGFAPVLCATYSFMWSWSSYYIHIRPSCRHVPVYYGYTVDMRISQQTMDDGGDEPAGGVKAYTIYYIDEACMGSMLWVIHFNPAF